MPDTAHLPTVDNPAHDSLLIALDCAVPLWMLQLRAETPAAREHTRRLWAQGGASIVASQGDVLQYGSKRPGEAAKAFNALAQGLAALAWQPGGVTFAGRHWCVDHDACATADATAGEPLHEPTPDPGPTFRGRPLVDVPVPPEVL
ncbi:hypothetical protein AB0N38_14045 [Micromonospora aurantiaca]|uniref:hypothetical protein n=1 Tax=Micromonospora aurantiaca (nom. illeg.) TaxID=47850 RepID=UPI003421EDA0